MKILGTTAMHASSFKRMSNHVLYDRAARLEFVESLGGEPLISYLISYENKIRIHTILNSGVVVIGSIVSQEIITVLPPSRHQLKKYGIKDRKLLSIAQKNRMDYLEKFGRENTNEKSF